MHKEWYLRLAFESNHNITIIISLPQSPIFWTIILILVVKRYFNLVEWGMHPFQSSMPHIKDRIKFEQLGEQQVTLLVMILLYNLQARMVGINQLNSFYTEYFHCKPNLFTMLIT